jgi:Class II flagellar assembly regulator
MALQGGDDDAAQTPLRRRRQIERAGRALDVLDRLAVGLLEGRAPGSLRADLVALRTGLERTGDAGLDDLLLEVDIRAAVELAKLERDAQMHA